MRQSRPDCTTKGVFEQGLGESYQHIHEVAEWGLKKGQGASGLMAYAARASEVAQGYPLHYVQGSPPMASNSAGRLGNHRFLLAPYAIMYKVVRAVSP